MRVLLLLRGSPGCGKTTWIEENGLKPYALSSDDIRTMCAAPELSPDGTYEIAMRNDTTVWDMLFSILEKRMENGEFTVIDATNSKTSEMKRYKDLCDEYRYRIYLVDFTGVPMETAKERNAGRPELKRVPDAAIEKMYARFETQKVPAGITVVKPDELDKIWLKPLDLSEYRAVHIVGDIHGCFTALMESFPHDENGELAIPDDELWIFAGDYIDRGLENAEVVKFLLSVYEKRNFVLLEGNHERWLWKWANGGTTKSKEFECRTRPQLDNAGIDPKDVRRLYRRFAQCAWFRFGGSEILVTHGGISRIPENMTLLSTRQMIAGTGSYNDADETDEAFARNTAPNAVSIHGHRNVKKVPARANEKVFNLEGGVESGGSLRIVDLFPDGRKETREVRNTVFEVREKPDARTETVADTILSLRENKFVQEKQFGNISSFNFTKSAFYDKVWNAQTTKARGLYINIPKQKVVARAYDKFFNLGERRETELDALGDTMMFPASAYVKENGFLGIVSYNEEDDSFFVTTKSSPTGEFADWLRAMLTEKVGSDGLERMKLFSKTHNVSFVFECVDMIHDPHVIDYPESRLVLLDVVYNSLDYHKFPYDELQRVGKLFGLDVKTLAQTFESWQEFFEWYNGVMEEDYTFEGRQIEGFVVEDAAGLMVKIKLAYYNFWKFMRAIAHKTVRCGAIPGKLTGQLTTPTANRFYAWVRDYEDKAGLPNDICNLRRMFYESERRNQPSEQQP